MIDLDKFDDLLEQALTSDVRALRKPSQDGLERPAPEPRAPERPTPEPRAAQRRAPKPRAFEPPAAEPAAPRFRPSVVLPTLEKEEGALLAPPRTKPRSAFADPTAVRARLAEAARRVDNRTDAAASETMHALFEGREDDARVALGQLKSLAADRAWAQRLWFVLEWGSVREHDELLDHCREQAYRYGDEVWRSALTLVLARSGRTDEASHGLHQSLAGLGAGVGRDHATALDIATNLAEAAFLLGAAHAAPALEPLVSGAPDALVVGADGWIYKGALARYRAHIAAVAGRRTDADRLFAEAVQLHRQVDARPLLARTLQEWGTFLTGRDDEAARRCLGESAHLASELRLAGLTSPAGTPPLATGR